MTPRSASASRGWRTCTSTRTIDADGPRRRGYAWRRGARQEDDAMKPTSLSSSSEQEFPYGWRYVRRVTPDGGEEWDQVALTLEDVLHPQEGDVIPESKPHEADRRHLIDVFESRPLSPPFAL